MNMAGDWDVVEGDVASILRRHPRPLDDLASGGIAALVLRGAYAPADCQRLMARLLAQGLLYDPRQPVPDEFLEQAIPEGYYREGRNVPEAAAWREHAATGKRRIDVGTSLGYRGSDPEDFFSHARQTRALFARLFAGGGSPVQLVYDRLRQLAGGKQVVTAHEPDGREYGPAIIRAHYGGYAYAPHFDSVRLREKREEYSVYQFEHQFAGVLVLQNSQLGGETAQCKIHRCFWDAEVDPHLKAGTFHDFARQRAIPHVEVHLDPGDLYFFNTRRIHEVPGVAGELPRVVLATFIGYSRDRERIFVWS